MALNAENIVGSKVSAKNEFTVGILTLFPVDEGGMMRENPMI